MSISLSRCCNVLSQIWSLSRALIVLIGFSDATFGQLPELARLTHVEDVAREDLDAINRIAISRDGKFLYAAAWSAGTVTTFERLEGGRLNHLSTVKLPQIAGAIDVALSPDQRFAAVVAFRSNSLTVFDRDPQSGNLKIDGFSRQELRFSNALDFSPDSKFLYVSNAQDDAPLTGSVVCYAVDENGALRNVQKLDGADFYGMRDVLVSRDGKKLYAACEQAGTVLEFDRQPDTGKMELVTTFRDGEDGVNSIAGVLSLELSADGRNLFCVSGRFHGDNAVTWFRQDGNGRMQYVTELDELGEFRGGNSIQFDPTGKTLYATATVSGSMAAIEVDMANDQLRLLTTLVDGQHGLLTGASGLTFSPDGQYLYLAVEDADAIGIYKFVSPEKQSQVPKVGDR